MFDHLLRQDQPDGIDRRGFLKCMAWVGTGLVYTLSGGVLRSQTVAQAVTAASRQPIGKRPEWTFAQISDSHIGFHKEANPDVVATLQTAVDRLNALPVPPAFLLHTGDLSHLSQPAEFDTLDQVLKSCKTTEVHFVPGEHDVLNDNGQQYRTRYGKQTHGDGWYSFNSHGAHFVGLVNVQNLKPGGLGALGHDQLEWLEDDLAGQSDDTPIVVFAHIPLWTVYPQWGWGTDDSAQALAYLKRFGSVSVLNGHIHQVLQKVEGHITFHTARSTAFPQPVPGTAPSPGPLKVPAAKLRSLLGLTDVTYVPGRTSLAIIDSTLGSAS